MMCRVTNLTSMDVVIEDIGMRLQPTGGKDSSKVVRADMVDASQDIKDCARWVHVERFEISMPSARLPSPPPVRHVPVSPPVPVSSPLPLTNSERAELDMLRRSVDQVFDRQEKMLELLSSLASRTGNFSPSAPVPVQFQVVAPPDDEPLILPGNLIPDSVEISVRASESTLARDDFETTLAALKKAKNK